jgi:hypothetical protein
VEDSCTNMGLRMMTWSSYRYEQGVSRPRPSLGGTLRGDWRMWLPVRLSSMRFCTNKLSSSDYDLPNYLKGATSSSVVAYAASGPIKFSPQGKVYFPAMEFGLNRDKQTVRPPRDRLITKISWLHHGKQTVHSGRCSQSTDQATHKVYFI